MLLSEKLLRSSFWYTPRFLHVASLPLISQPYFAPQGKSFDGTDILISPCSFFFFFFFFLWWTITGSESWAKIVRRERAKGGFCGSQACRTVTVADNRHILLIISTMKFHQSIFFFFFRLIRLWSVTVHRMKNNTLKCVLQLELNLQKFSPFFTIFKLN